MKTGCFLRISGWQHYPLQAKCSRRPEPSQIIQLPIRSASRRMTRFCQNWRSENSEEGAQAGRTTSTGSVATGAWYVCLGNSMGTREGGGQAWQRWWKQRDQGKWGGGQMTRVLKAMVESLNKQGRHSPFPQKSTWEKRHLKKSRRKHGKHWNENASVRESWRPLEHLSGLEKSSQVL